jgi:fructose-1,6-bisphosphatase I
MDLVPGKLHERVSVVLGSKNEVTRVTAYHADTTASAAAKPLG